MNAVVWIVLFVISLLVNVVLICVLVSRMRVFSALKQAIIATFGQPVHYHAVSLPPPPAFRPEFDREMALFGSALLLNFAINEHLPGALTYLTFGGGHIGALVLANNVLWIVFRGTRTRADFAADMKFQQRDHVHAGFLDVFDAIWPGLEQAMEHLHDLKACVVVGHSLGAAVATLTTRALNALVECVGYAFGSPRVGDLLFAASYAATLYNVMNTDDLITDLPFAVMPNPRKPSRPLLYQHVGTEVGFRTNKGSWFQNHSLVTYREFLDGFPT